jgi:hypothetical protein
MQPYNEQEVLEAIKLVEGTFIEAQIVPNLAGMVWVARILYDYCGGMSWDQSEKKHIKELRVQLGLPNPEPPIPPLTSLRVREGRLWDGARYIGWRGISEFDAIHAVRTGNEADLIRRLDRAKENGCNGIRVLMMAENLFQLAPSMPNYWEALTRAVNLANERGLYVELCIFADAQMVMPNHQARLEFAKQVADYTRDWPGVIYQLSNEPMKNGWQSATDPELLQIAQNTTFSAPFSIGDPSDYVTDPATGEPLRSELEKLGRRSPILVLHGERKYQDSRFAGWVDHLKGFDEVYDNPEQDYRIHDEPMGAAAEFINGRRDNRPDAHRAAALVCAVLGIGFTFHYISAQSDATPGLDGQSIASAIPQTPDYHFKNAGYGSVLKFTGWDKIRTTDNGVEAWAVAYGHPNVQRTIEWASGWKPTVYYESPSVILYHATR